MPKSTGESSIYSANAFVMTKWNCILSTYWWNCPCA